MATVGFIGSGNIGGAVARLAVAAGYDVVLSNSRGPQTLEDLVEELGPRAGGYPRRGRGSGRPRRRKRPAESPVGGTGAAAGRQAGPPREQLHPTARRTDTGAVRRPTQQRGAAAPPAYRACGQGVQQHHYWHLGSLARPAGATDRSALPIAGDDPAAKAAVTRFLDAIGYDTVDAGPLGPGGRRFQFGTRALVTPYGGLSDERGTPAGVAAIRAALGL